MKFPNLFTRNKNSDHKPAVVIFAGGMGTQIIQAAVYHELKSAGRTVYADVSYFERPQKLARVGNTGELTHWGWQLDCFGMMPASFEIRPSGLNKRNADLISDGPRMTEIGLKALKRPDVRRYFDIPAELKPMLPVDANEGYLCIHIRRGDYVNVASHLISDQQFLGLAKKFSGLVGRVVVLSDSPIQGSFRNELLDIFKNISFLDNIDAVASHYLMRHSRILFCSNSSFSLTAAVLNPEALVIIPRRWYGVDDSNIEAPIHAHNLFEIMETT